MMKRSARITVETLVELGYRVLWATRGLAALDILDTGNDIDLLFTDVVMPGGVNGRQLRTKPSDDGRV